MHHIWHAIKHYEEQGNMKHNQEEKKTMKKVTETSLQMAHILQSTHKDLKIAVISTSTSLVWESQYDWTELSPGRHKEN